MRGVLVTHAVLRMRGVLSVRCGLGMPGVLSVRRGLMTPRVLVMTGALSARRALGRHLVLIRGLGISRVRVVPARAAVRVVHDSSPRSALAST
ncbi:hypothetical protein [Thermocrispum municipale]|uniref:hypothetical protein n=1 Tax=Thermocrispum municipale TaxID=37926 RepID=UPI0012EB4A83|nr:hypothetical protein [Thermocrispum municipale]